MVDSGGAGFLLLLDAALQVTDGRPIPALPDAPDDVAARLDRAAGRERRDAGGLGGAGDGSGPRKDVSELRYEVMYLLDAPDEAMAGFREVWSGLGDSIVVVGGDGTYNCHIHTDLIGASIEAAVEIGRPRNIRVTDLTDEVGGVEEEKWVRDAEAPEEPDPEPVNCAVVAVATGGGIRRIFENLRVQRVVTGGQTMNPSTALLLDAVEAVPADEVVVLPNNKNIVAVAEQLDSLTDKTVHVLATTSVTEGFAALLAYDPEASASDNADAMGELARSVVTGEVTRAVRDSHCPAGPIRAGDWIGIAPGGIEVVADSVEAAATGLLDALVDDHELVTLIEGDGASTTVTRHLTEWVGDHRPGVEVEVHRGDQPLYPYLIGVE